MSDQAFIKIQSETSGLLARSFVYYVMAGLMRHPRSNGGPRFFRDHRKIFGEIMEVLAEGRESRLKNNFDALSNGLEDVTEREWINQYENKMGHTANSKVPAYELEYGEEHSHRQPQELADITAFYKAFGLQVNVESSHERPDHVSVELEFMYVLLRKEAYACEKGDEQNALVCRDASQRFLSDHLGRWVPSFAVRLARHAEDGWMKQTGDLLAQFVLEECRLQQVTAGPPGLPVRRVQEKEETGCVSCQYGPSPEQKAGGGG